LKFFPELLHDVSLLLREACDPEPLTVHAQYLRGVVAPEIFLDGSVPHGTLLELLGKVFFFILTILIHVSTSRYVFRNSRHIVFSSNGLIFGLCLYLVAPTLWEGWGNLSERKAL
jgi:sensor histidine kinase YesM